MAKQWRVDDLDVNKDAGCAARNILLTRFNEAFSFKQDVMNTGRPVYIHDMRVSARRLQTCLWLFRSFLPKEEYQHHNAILTSLIKRLGKVRTYDVFIEMIRQDLSGIKAGKKSAISLVISRQRKKRYNRLRRLLKILRKMEAENFERDFTAFLDTL